MAVNMSKNESRRRFSDQQIRLLESMFETDSRPELRMKQQVANRLGLQPRQVAIWFQNKRARSKSRQIEKEYRELKTNYDDLSSRFESLKKENQSLLTQLQSLRNPTPNHQGGRNRGVAYEESSSSKVYKSRNIISKTEDQDYFNFLSEANNQGIDVPYYEDSSTSIAHLTEESKILDMRELQPDPSKFAENRYSNESNALLENINCSSGWWKF